MHLCIRYLVLAVSALSLLTMPAFLALGLAMVASGHEAIGIPVALLSLLFGWGYIRTVILLRGKAGTSGRAARPTTGWTASPAW